MNVQYNCLKCNVTSYDVPVEFDEQGQAAWEAQRKQRIERAERIEKYDRLCIEATKLYCTVLKYASKVKPSEFLQSSFPELYKLYNNTSYYPFTEEILYSNSKQEFWYCPGLYGEYFYAVSYYNHTITCPVCRHKEKFWRQPEE